MNTSIAAKKLIDLINSTVFAEAADYTSKEHLLFMCNSIIKREDDNPNTIEKNHRWIGYVQGVLVSMGTPLEVMKVINSKS